MKALITQSNYIPWKGYFDSIKETDVFVVYDDMQYTKRDWRNRNKINTPQGLKWMSIPVEVKGKYFQKIRDTKVSVTNWNVNHWNLIKQNYKNAKSYKEVKDWLENLYMTCTMEHLTEINVHFITEICAYLQIPLNLRFSSEFNLHEEKTQRLVDICTDLNATEYFSGPAAKSYMQEELFNEKGIEVKYFKYGPYDEYTQEFPPFEHGVSIIDLILNEGENSINFLKK